MSNAQEFPTTLPRILFVLGKGGVGRSTVSTALGLMLAQRGERVLVMEWTLAEAIAPWFGMPPAGQQPVEVAPRLSVLNYRLDEALRAYFVDHLKLEMFYRRVLRGPHVRRLVEAAPGIAELLFIGQLWWLTTLAAQEAGLHFDRIIVDAPATGHGASLLDLPATVARVGAAGLLATEVQRVTGMMADPQWTGTVVVTLPDELAMEETLALVPRVTGSLGRAPLAALINRSVARWVGDAENPPWLPPVLARLSPVSQDALRLVHHELHTRVLYERALTTLLQGRTAWGTWSLDDQLAASLGVQPLDVVRALALALRGPLEAAP